MRWFALGVAVGIIGMGVFVRWLSASAAREIIGRRMW